MKNQIDCIARMTAKFASLPGVGKRTAARYAYAVVDMTDKEAEDFCACIAAIKSEVRHCSVCGTFTDREICSICSERDRSVICVVAHPKDVLAMEKVRGYGGVYHVLFGCLSPLDNRGPDDIRIAELLKRVTGGGVAEVIVATNPDVEGEATASYIAKLLKPFEVKVSRIAQGIQLGSEIEYADEITLTRALEDRKPL